MRQGSSRRWSSHPAVRRINFTGSTKVGRIIAELAGRHLKPVLLELGGKAPLVVLDDADIDGAVNAAVFGAFMNQGQICMSTERLIVDETVADEFVAKLAARASKLPAGDPRGHVVLGSLISSQSAEKMDGLIADAVKKGAKLVAGGKRTGTVVEATVLDHVTPDMRIYAEESFGPVKPVIRVKGEDEAVRIANDTDYGLSSAVFSKDVSARAGGRGAHRVRHLPHQRPDRRRRGADAVRRRQGFGLRPLRRQGGDRRIHRSALDHHRGPAAALPVLRGRRAKAAQRPCFHVEPAPEFGAARSPRSPRCGRWPGIRPSRRR